MAIYMIEHWRVDKVGFPLSGWFSRRFLCSSLDPECESLCYGGPGAVVPSCRLPLKCLLRESNLS